MLLNSSKLNYTVSLTLEQSLFGAQWIYTSIGGMSSTHFLSRLSDLKRVVFVTEVLFQHSETTLYKSQDSLGIKFVAMLSQSDRIQLCSRGYEVESKQMRELGHILQWLRVSLLDSFFPLKTSIWSLGLILANLQMPCLSLATRSLPVTLTTKNYPLKETYTSMLTVLSWLDGVSSIWRIELSSIPSYQRVAEQSLTCLPLTRTVQV